jgi:hypothetical protein
MIAEYYLYSFSVVNSSCYVFDKESDKTSTRLKTFVGRCYKQNE